MDGENAKRLSATIVAMCCFVPLAPKTGSPVFGGTCMYRVALRRFQ
jgi:hypothetical protein